MTAHNSIHKFDTTIKLKFSDKIFVSLFEEKLMIKLGKGHNKKNKQYIFPCKRSRCHKPHIKRAQLQRSLLFLLFNHNQASSRVYFILRIR